MNELFEFYVHGAASIYGRGSKSDAHKLCSMMNMHRSLDRFDVREIDQLPGRRKPKPAVVDIAAEIKRFY